MKRKGQPKCSIMQQFLKCTVHLMQPKTMTSTCGIYYIFLLDMQFQVYNV